MGSGCHRCPHDAEIRRLREACLTCRRCGGDFIKLGSMSHVSLDAARDEKCRHKIELKTAVEYRPPGGASAPVYRNIPPNVVPWLLDAFRAFADLNEGDAALVVLMMKGKRLVDIARDRGFHVQTVHARWKKIVSKNPVWKAIATGMIGSGRGRKPGKAAAARPGAKP